MTRLIDANKLKMYIDTCQFCEKCPNIAFMCQRSCELPDCLTSQWERVIDEQQTVDAVPVRHGRWIAHTMYEITGYDPALSGDDPVCTYSCSVCGEDCYVSDTGDDILSNYCPNCGARLIE